MEQAWPSSGTPSKGRPAARASSPSRVAREGEAAQPLRGCCISGFVPSHDGHHGHAHGDAERHLRQDHGLRAVDDLGVDLHAAVDRAGVHDDGVRLGQAQLLGREAEAFEVLLAGGQQRAAHAFVLQAQHDDHVAVPDALLQRVEDAHAHLRQVRGHQGARADHAHLGGAQRGQGVDVRARHARVQHVAHDGHAQVGEVLLVVADGVHVQQPLRGVGMAAVAGVDHVDMGRHVLGDQIGCARLAVAHDEEVGGHGREVGDGVQQRLALAGRAACDVQVEHVGRQALGRDLERGARARAVLEEQVEHALAAQQRHLLDFAVVDADEVGGRVQDVGQDVPGQSFGGQQVDQFAVLVELGIALVQHVRPLGCGIGRHRRRHAPATAVGRPAAPRARRRSPAGRAARVRPGPPAPPGARRPGGRSHRHQDVGAVDVEVDLGLCAGGHAALREVVAVQGRGQHAVAAGQVQVLVQALDQPGTARGDAGQARTGPHEAAHAAQQFATPQKLFKNDAGRGRIGIRCTTCQGLGGAVALVHFVDGQAEAAPELAAEFLRAGRVLVGIAIRVVGHADDQGVGLPGLDALAGQGQARLAGLGAYRGQRVGRAQHAHAHGTARALGAEVEGHETLEMGGTAAAPGLVAPAALPAGAGAGPARRAHFGEGASSAAGPAGPGRGHSGPPPARFSASSDSMPSPQGGIAPSVTKQAPGACAVGQGLQHILGGGHLQPARNRHGRGIGRFIVGRALDAMGFGAAHEAPVGLHRAPWKQGSPRKVVPRPAPDPPFAAGFPA
ncbi:hypothetical protein FQR65_LT20132 [Abscondita terminalis]|nr:hypothetical protein FQR65_LT20132 [Abscondita terminalis]